MPKAQTLGVGRGVAMSPYLGHKHKTNTKHVVTVKILRHARSICIMFIFGRITHVTMFLFNKSSKMYNVSPTWASSGAQINTQYKNDRNIITK